MAPERNSDNLFGKWHDVVMLVLGFSLTGIVGTILTNRFQSESQRQAATDAKADAERARESERRRWELDRATEFYREFSRMLDTRRYHSLRLALAFRDGSGDDKLGRINNDYSTALIDWNINLNHNLAFCQLYFGEELASRFELNIGSKMRSINSRLLTSVRDHRAALAEIEEVGVMIYDLNYDILKAIQEGRVGSFKTEAERKRR
jgi:hypothetical protein